MLARAANHHGLLCSGATDWKRDGCVTEAGWVADLVNQGVPAGEMLCPANPFRITETYVDLLTLDPASVDPCVDLLGSPPRRAPDGEEIKNPCRTIVEANLGPGDELRRQLVESAVYLSHYNTNYTASWFLVRSGVLLDESGNLKQQKPGCEVSLLSRDSTYGPLNLTILDSSNRPPSFVPLLGCGAPGPALPANIGPVSAGEATVLSFTRGPVRNASMDTPEFAKGTSRNGDSGWWRAWAHLTLQDYRGFAPVHRDSCNLLFADGSVRNFVDENGDGLLNNGFESTSSNGFADNTPELPAATVFSRYSLTERNLRN
jgi:prepilin-type processing-associated H-X9-DG protein